MTRKLMVLALVAFGTVGFTACADGDTDDTTTTDTTDSTDSTDSTDDTDS